MSIRVAVLGVGYWGINYVRSFAQLVGGENVFACDEDVSRLERVRSKYPAVQCVPSFANVLSNQQIDAVVIATRIPTHSEIAAQCLQHGKHILIEKPMALEAAVASDLTLKANQNGLCLMVGHLMLFHPAVQHMTRLLHGGGLGELYYLSGKRLNLGRYGRESNALWTFAPHDLSIFDALLKGQLPIDVSVRGESYLRDGIEDFVFLSLRYSDKVMANVELSWLHPRKERVLTVVGSKKMLEFNDISQEQLRVYDKGFEGPPEFSDFGEFLSIRDGGIEIPQLKTVEPLLEQCRHFLDCIRENKRPLCDGESGTRITRILQAAQTSLRQNGTPVSLKPMDQRG